MRIEYKNSFINILGFQCFHQFVSPVVQTTYLIFSSLAFLVAIQNSSIFSSAVTALCWYMALWIVQIIFTTIYYFTKSNKTDFAKRSLEITEEGLVEENEFNKSIYYWHGPLKIVHRPGFVAVYVTSHAAHVIPNYVFANKEQKEKFLGGISNRIIKNNI